MHALSAAGRPLHVVNATLNLVADDSLAMQEQRSESFTMSALHAGSRRVGYRPSAEYAGGISLAEAMTVSGAAVSPNMGAASKPALTFLLTLFNARLGAWLANPGAAGRDVWRRPHLSYGAAPLLDEMFGRTSDRDPYVYLSDGGHFENLGLYEMVLRRCRFIVVCDAGCDPGYRFDDLANAIRKVRLDFGVDIEFPDGLGIAGPTRGLPRRARPSAESATRRSTHAPQDGVLLYLKAALCGDEPVDVANYAAAHPPFPHQPTDQPVVRRRAVRELPDAGAALGDVAHRGPAPGGRSRRCARAVARGGPTPRRVTGRGAYIPAADRAVQTECIGLDSGVGAPHRRSGTSVRAPREPSVDQSPCGPGRLWRCPARDSADGASAQRLEQHARLDQVPRARAPR